MLAAHASTPSATPAPTAGLAPIFQKSAPSQSTEPETWRRGDDGRARRSEMMRNSVPELQLSGPIGDPAATVLVADASFFNGATVVERPHWAFTDASALTATMWVFPTEEVKDVDRFYRKERPHGLQQRHGLGADQAPGVKWRTLLHKVRPQPVPPTVVRDAARGL